MADSIIGSIAIAIKAKNDELINGLKESNAKIVDFKNKFSSDFGAVAAVGAAAFAAVAFAIKKSVDAASEAEQVDNDLVIALHNAGIASQKAADDAKAYATALEFQTGVGDEAIKRGMTELIQFGLTGDALKVATQASLDLAAAKKIDLASAAEQVGKAFIGETGRLKQFGIVIDESLPKADRFKVVMEQMNEKFGGQAQGQLDTFDGKMKLLKESFGDFMENVGGLFLPVLKKFIDMLTAASIVVNEFFQTRLIPGIQVIRDAVSNLGGFRTAIMAMLEGLRAAMNAIPGMDSVLRTMGSSLASVNTALDTAQAKLTAQGEAARASGQAVIQTDTAVAQNKVTQEQIRAQQMLLIAQLEQKSKLALAEDAEKERQAIAKEADSFTSDMQKAAEAHDADIKKRQEKSEADHRAVLETVARQSEQAMTTIFSTELDSRQKKQKIFQQGMDLLQKQITESFIASQSKQSAAAVRSSAVESGAAKAPIAANFFKAFSPIPFIGQILAIAAIGAAFSFIDHLVKFSKGGEVGGSGSSDTVPALLTPGERVLTRDQNSALKNGNFGGSTVNLVVNVNGTLVEGNEAHWRQLFKNHIMPEVRRQTMVAPTGPHLRKRGATR